LHLLPKTNKFSSTALMVNEYMVPLRRLGSQELRAFGGNQTARRSPVDVSVTQKLTYE
jgi:hypothetical protein